MFRIADLEIKIHLFDHFQLLGLTIFVMEIGGQAYITYASRYFVDGKTVLVSLQADKLIARVDFTKICCQDISRSFIDHDAREDNDRCLYKDVEVHFLRTLLNLRGLVGRSLTSSIINCLHFTKLDAKLHDLPERLLEKIELDRAGA